MAFPLSIYFCSGIANPVAMLRGGRSPAIKVFSSADFHWKNPGKPLTVPDVGGSRVAIGIDEDHRTDAIPSTLLASADEVIE
jgi:hypothetical protein